MKVLGCPLVRYGRFYSNVVCGSGPQPRFGTLGPSGLRHLGRRLRQRCSGLDSSGIVHRILQSREREWCVSGGRRGR